MQPLDGAHQTASMHPSAPAWLSPARRRALAHGLAIAIVVVVGYYDLLVLHDWLGIDAHAYWGAWTHDLYGIPAHHRDAYLYAPAFAQLIWPLTLLPWEAFVVLWAGSMTALFAWLLRPLPALWFWPALVLCLPEALQGNVNALLALVVVLGFRHPAAWAFALLTKVSTAVGLLWFAARGEWRALLPPIIVAALVSGVSYVLRPDLWQAWFALLVGGVTAGDTTFLFPLRLAGAVVLVAWGARTGRRWTVAVGVILASPIFFLNTLTVLAALPRLQAMPRPAALGRARLRRPGPAAPREVAGARG
jgi:Glycosyltransferase family 87